MNCNRVDLELARSRYHPRIGVAAFFRSPETFGGAGEHDSGNRWVLEDGACAARLRRNSLHFSPTIAGVLAFVDTAAGGSDDVIWITWIDVDGKEVGIVNDSVLHRLPALPAVN